MQYFRLYGCEVVSEIPLPLDPPGCGTFRERIVLRCGRAPQGWSRALVPLAAQHSHGRLVRISSDAPPGDPGGGRHWCCEVDDLLRFCWDTDSPTVTLELESGEHVELAGFWLIGLVLPLFLTLRGGFDFFHAGAALFQGEPVLFMAPSTGGKSTLVDYCLGRGHALVADDKVPVIAEDGGLMAAGAYPYCRPYRSSEDLGRRVTAFAQHFAPLRTVYLLERRDPQAELQFEEVEGFRKFDAVGLNQLFRFDFLAADRLHRLAPLLEGLRVFRLGLPWDRKRLPEVYQAICRHREFLP